MWYLAYGKPENDGTQDPLQRFIRDGFETAVDAFAMLTGLCRQVLIDNEWEEEAIPDDDNDVIQEAVDRYGVAWVVTDRFNPKVMPADLAGS